MSVVRCRQLSKPRMWANFDLTYKIEQTGRVTVPLKWESENLVTLKMPIPTGIIRGVRVHKRAAPVFQAWFRSWDAEACKEVKEFGGSFVPRLMRQAKNLPASTNPTKDWNSFLSRHSRGIAMDLNHNFPLNAQGKAGVPEGLPGSLHRVIALARDVRVTVTDPAGASWEAGIVCGIDFGGRLVDPMHFEIGQW
jgi:hypothetical protein